MTLVGKSPLDILRQSMMYLKSCLGVAGSMCGIYGGQQALAWVSSCACITAHKKMGTHTHHLIELRSLSLIDVTEVGKTEARGKVDVSIHRQAVKVNLEKRSGLILLGYELTQRRV